MSFLPNAGAEAMEAGHPDITSTIENSVLVVRHGVVREAQRVGDPPESDAELTPDEARLLNRMQDFGLIHIRAIAATFPEAVARANRSNAHPTSVRQVLKVINNAAPRPSAARATGFCSSSNPSAWARGVTIGMWHSSKRPAFPDRLTFEVPTAFAGLRFG